VCIFREKLFAAIEIYLFFAPINFVTANIFYAYYDLLLALLYTMPDSVLYCMQTIVIDMKCAVLNIAKKLNIVQITNEWNILEYNNKINDVIRSVEHDNKIFWKHI
jgi:hypothetical protein